MTSILLSLFFEFSIILEITSFDKFSTLIADVDKSICLDYGVFGKKKFMGREYDGVFRTTFVINQNKVIEKIDAITGSTLIAIHNGEDSGQEIPHVHVHLIPRSKDDNAGSVHRMFNETPNISDSELDQLCKRLKIS